MPSAGISITASPRRRSPSNPGKRTCSWPPGSASISTLRAARSIGCLTRPSRSIASLPRPAKRCATTSESRNSSAKGRRLLFRFEFDGTIDGQPLLSMRDGCAGFFTPEELAAGQGIVRTELQRRPQPGKTPPSWQSSESDRPTIESYSSEQFGRARVTDDFPNGFGIESSLETPFNLPDEDRLRLIHRITHFDPKGGRFGLGLIRGEADIHPDDWFLTCHFVDDQVMPGTLMYECCLHTLRIGLLRMGCVGDSAATWQPVLGVTSRLKCRGQVTAVTKTVVYEVAIKEIGYDPEPFAIADALMYADGKAIVDVQDMTLRLTGYVSPADEPKRVGRDAADSPSLVRRRNEIVFDS